MVADKSKLSLTQRAIIEKAMLCNMSLNSQRLEGMVNPSPTLQTIDTDTWVKATWDEFLTFADDPTLISGRFYYDQGELTLSGLKPLRFYRQSRLLCDPKPDSRYGCQRPSTQFA